MKNLRKINWGEIANFVAGTFFLSVWAKALRASKCAFFRHFSQLKFFNFFCLLNTWTSPFFIVFHFHFQNDEYSSLLELLYIWDKRGIYGLFSFYLFAFSLSPNSYGHRHALQLFCSFHFSFAAFLPLPKHKMMTAGGWWWWWRRRKFSHL